MIPESTVPLWPSATNQTQSPTPTTPNANTEQKRRSGQRDKVIIPQSMKPLQEAAQKATALAALPLLGVLPIVFEDEDPDAKYIPGSGV